ncbi:Protein of unknown function [Pyronema omphalodes CBS 100304]|uniref:Uncharacterized protein n=1 Tax=Pyronema omphalodes (strain CBS 100304) TaxID=1076935 RepID=U4LKM3_PYROM|nr:Protein of unknown function [Pyronema omphalodes CBS 100304]
MLGAGSLRGSPHGQQQHPVPYQNRLTFELLNLRHTSSLQTQFLRVVVKATGATGTTDFVPLFADWYVWAKRRTSTRKFWRSGEENLAEEVHEAGKVKKVHKTPSSVRKMKVRKNMKVGNELTRWT